MSRKDSAPSKGKGQRPVGKADARSNSSFSGLGGKASDPTNGGGGSKGIGSGGGKAYHAAAKSKENSNPPSARNYDSFSGVGGKAKTSN